jgi:hypothetical protein
MFTVEEEFNTTIVVTMDESNTFEDVEIWFDPDGVVWMRQYCEELKNHQLIHMSYQQLLDILCSMQRSQGMYYLERQRP